MKTRDLTETLSAHADDLNAGRERPETAPAQAAPLLAVARQVHGVLKPVAPRPEFLAALKAQLGAEARSPAIASTRPQANWVWVLAGLGGLISVASAALIAARFISRGARRVGEALDKPAARLASAKMRAAH